jgi:hypothetical protein
MQRRPTPPVAATRIDMARKIPKPSAPKSRARVARNLPVRQDKAARNVKAGTSGGILVGMADGSVRNLSGDGSVRLLAGDGSVNILKGN